MRSDPATFEAFWPTYLMEHRDPRCRALHFVGTSGAAIGIIAAIIRRDALWLAGGLVFAYTLAWIGHIAIERNRPATFRHPIWSLAGDIRMYLLWLTFRLAPAIAAAETAVGAAPKHPPGAPRHTSS